MDFSIVYEDNHIIVAIKPQNVPSQEDISGDPSFLEMIREHIRVKYNKPGNVYTGLVHRLDRPAGGLMVFARTSKAAARLAEQMKNGDFRKTYAAVLCGHPEELPIEGQLEDWLIKDRQKNTSSRGKKGDPGAKWAHLGYRIARIKNGYALAFIELDTGRSHQIRVQFSLRGAPLAGDFRYGGTKDPLLCLWATKIRFLHPTRKEEMIFSSPFPEYYPWSLFEEMADFT